MIVANIAYAKPTRPDPGCSLEIIQVQILEIWKDADRVWAKIRALDCQPFPGIKDGQPYPSDWTVVDNKRLHDTALLFTPRKGRLSRPEQRRRVEESLLRDNLLGGGHERTKTP